MEDMINGLSLGLKTAKISDVIDGIDAKGKKYKLYQIDVSNNGGEDSRIFRRFSQFVFLEKMLKKKLKSHNIKLPSKKWLGNLDPNFVVKRRQGLSEYMQGILANAESARSRDVNVFFTQRLDDAVRAGTMTEQEVKDLKEISRFKMSELRAIFQRVTMEHPDRKLNKDQFNEIMKEMGLSDESNYLLFSAIDSDGSGTVDFREVIVGLSALMRGSIDEKALFLYNLYDLDGNGTVSKGEVMAIVMSLDKMATNLTSGSRASVSGHLALNLVDEVFAVIDINKDGELQYDEFKLGLAKFPEIFDATTAFSEGDEGEGS